MGKTHRNNIYEDWNKDKTKTKKMQIKKIRMKKKERQKNILINKNLLPNELDELE